MKKHSIKVYVLVYFKELKYYNEVVREFKKITNNIILDEEILIVGYNDIYDVDVNVMIKKSIQDFINKEKIIKEIKEKYHLDILLEVVPALESTSSDPKPILSIDKEVVKFLYKSQIKFDLDYYIY